MKFKYNFSLSSKILNLTLMSLKDWCFVSILGKDSLKFSQNQFTCDIKKLLKFKYIITSHCNIYGKLYNVFYLFFFNNGVSLLIKKDIVKKHLKILHKYALFYDIQIKLEKNKFFFGLAGKNSISFVKKIFPYFLLEKYNFYYMNNIIILYFQLPKDRFLLISSKYVYYNILHFFRKKISINNTNQWLSLDIESGYPIMIDSLYEKYSPIDINLDIFNGISFDKGCFLGQEILSKIKYRNICKYTLFWLEGYDVFPIFKGQTLYVLVNNFFIVAGIILGFSFLSKRIIWLQALLKKNIQCKIFVRCDKNDKYFFIIKKKYKKNNIGELYN